MRTVILPDSRAVGQLVAAEASAALNQALARQPRARLLLATGASQFDVLASLVRQPVDWERVDAFHLDEYEGLDGGHPASFRRYLKERVADLVPLNMHYVGPDDAQELERLSTLVAQAPFDVALVGVGENGHLAFNDPPADLTAQSVYLRVDLDERCRRQQVGEGWFATLDEVPRRAVSMSVQAILRSRHILCSVPYEAKSEVVLRLLSTEEVTPWLPASALLDHPGTTLFLDRASSRRLPRALWQRCVLMGL